MQTIDQKRAKKAYEIVETIVKLPDTDKKKTKFKTLALKFPSMVMQCGVLQALAYCMQKDASESSSGVFDKLSVWLTPLLPDIPGNLSIVEKLAAEGVTIWHYQMVTREAIAFGAWLKRAAATLLTDVETNE